MYEAHVMLLWLYWSFHTGSNCGLNFTRVLFYQLNYESIGTHDRIQTYINEFRRFMLYSIKLRGQIGSPGWNRTTVTSLSDLRSTIELPENKIISFQILDREQHLLLIRHQSNELAFQQSS